MKIHIPKIRGTLDDPPERLIKFEEALYEQRPELGDLIDSLTMSLPRYIGRLPRARAETVMRGIHAVVMITLFAINSALAEEKASGNGHEVEDL